MSGRVAAHSHIAAHIIAGDVAPFGYMVGGACIRSEAGTRARGCCLDGVLWVISACGSAGAEVLTCSMLVVILESENRKERCTDREGYM